MCDFSLQAVKSRPAKVGDKLVVHNFGYGTVGFVDPSSLEYLARSEHEAVCVMPGTEIGFDDCITESCAGGMFSFPSETVYGHSVAIFRQVNKETRTTHHDALEMPDGVTIMLTRLKVGQMATVLQLPAEPKNEQEAQEQKRLEIVA